MQEKPRGTPHLERRGFPGLLLALAFPALKVAAWLLALFAPRAQASAPRGLTVYQAYQVGDLFMALPAILSLSRHLPVTVVCRPDCLFLFAGSGVRAVAFACPFFARSAPDALWRSLRNAWALRGKLPGPALDLDADPRTALFLKVAGAGPTCSYARAYGWFFDHTFPLPAGIAHQADKNRAVAEAYLRANGPARGEIPASGAMQETAGSGAPAKALGSHPRPLAASAPLLLSCWTRKDEKNWPWEHWDKFLAYLIGEGRRLEILVPPDGDSGFRDFRRRWSDRTEFLAMDLETLHARADGAAGIICTDNFLGHMGAWLGKPVLWINGSSDPDQVAPQGPGTRIVQVETMPCRPCGHRCHNPVHKQCLRELRPETVIDAARLWLAEHALR